MTTLLEHLENQTIERILALEPADIAVFRITSFQPKLSHSPLRRKVASERGACKVDTSCIDLRTIINIEDTKMDMS